MFFRIDFEDQELTKMPNSNLSNGTCYFGKNNQTRGDFVPCGNIAYGNWPCCALGDSCLGFESANACYDPNCESNILPDIKSPKRPRGDLCD